MSDVKRDEDALDYVKYTKMNDEAYNKICKLIEIAIAKNKVIKITLNNFFYERRRKMWICRCRYFKKGVLIN